MLNITGNVHSVSSMSLSNDYHRLLIRIYLFSDLCAQLFNYNLYVSNDRLSNMRVNLNCSVIPMLADAIWTSNDNIVYIGSQHYMQNNFAVGAMTREGIELAYNPLNVGAISGMLSRYTDGTIYASNYNPYLHNVIGTRLFQSTDNGITWINTISAFEKGLGICWQAIRVTPGGELDTPDTDYFWTADSDYTGHNNSLSIHTVSRQNNASADDIHNVTRRNVSIPESVSGFFGGSCRFVLAYDGFETIFATNAINHSVLTWSIDGYFICQLLSLSNYTPKPGLVEPGFTIAVDSQNNMQYLGYRNSSIVSVFKLTYV